MADLVDGDAAGAELRRVTAGSGPAAHDAAVVDDAVGIGIEGVVAVAGVGVVGANVGDVVEVERLVVAPAECLLHAKLVPVVGPLGIDGPVNVPEGILEASALKVLVEDAHLLVDGVSL